MRLFLIIASLLGCGEESLPVDISGVDYDVGFVVLYPAGEGQPLRVTPTFGPGFGERPALTLEEQERRFIFVAMRRDELPPSFVFDRVSETDAVLEEPPANLLFEGTDTTERMRARLRVPGAVQLLTADLDADRSLRTIDEGEFDFFDRVTLRLPVDPEYCHNSGQTDLRHFAATANPILTLIPTYRTDFRSAIWIDEDRVVISAFSTLFLLQRDQPITSTTSGPGVWNVTDAADHAVRDSIRSLAVGPERADGSVEIVAVGGEGVPFGESRPADWGRVYFLQLDGDRFSETRPAIRTPNELYRSAAFTPDGRLWIGARGGRVFLRETETSSVSLVEDLPVRDQLDPIYRMIATGDAEFPLMASTKARVHVLDEDEWLSIPLERDGILGAESIEFRGLGFVRTEAGPDFWAAGSRGQIARKTPVRDWYLLENEGEELVFPPRFEPCASSRNPGEPLTFNKEIWSTATDGDYTFMGFENCTAIVAVRRDDQCVSMVPREGEPVGFEQTEARGMVKRGRRLLVFFSDGSLYETILP